MTWDNLPGGDLWVLEWDKHYFISWDNISLVIEMYGGHVSTQQEGIRVGGSSRVVGGVVVVTRSFS